MLGEKFQLGHSFLSQYCFGIESENDGQVTLTPRSFFSKDLVTLYLDLEQKMIKKGRLKMSRSLLSHSLYGGSAKEAAVDFLSSTLDRKFLSEIENWVGGADSAWWEASDSMDLERYSVKSQISQNWFQLTVELKGGSDSSWWKRITGR